MLSDGSRLTLRPGPLPPGRAQRSARCQLTATHDSDRPSDAYRPSSSTADEGLAPGFGEQFGRTRSAFGRLLSAHLALLRAELGEIMDRVKVVAMLAGAALGLALLVGVMLYVGGFLFIGEWLFGSIGWGLAHGTLFGLALIVVLAIAIVGVGWRVTLPSFGLAAILTVGIALLLGSNVLFQTADQLAQQLAPPFNTAAVVALLAGALMLGLLLAIAFWRMAGAGGALAGLVLGGVLGVFLGWLMGGIEWTWPPAVGFAVTLGLILWPIFHVALAWPRIDLEARMQQFVPRQTIDATNETREWLTEQWQTRRAKLGRR